MMLGFMCAIVLIAYATAECNVNGAATCQTTFTTCFSSAGQDKAAQCACWTTLSGCYSNAGCDLTTTSQCTLLGCTRQQCGLPEFKTGCGGTLQTECEDEYANCRTGGGIGTNGTAPTGAELCACHFNRQWCLKSKESTEPALKDCPAPSNTTCLADSCDAKWCPGTQCDSQQYLQCFQDHVNCFSDAAVHKQGLQGKSLWCSCAESYQKCQADIGCPTPSLDGDQNDWSRARCAEYGCAASTCTGGGGGPYANCTSASAVQCFNAFKSSSEGCADAKVFKQCMESAGCPFVGSCADFPGCSETCEQLRSTDPLVDEGTETGGQTTAADNPDANTASHLSNSQSIIVIFLIIFTFF